MRLKIASPAKKKFIENREETHQSIYVVSFTEGDDNYAVIAVDKTLKMWYYISTTQKCVYRSACFCEETATMLTVSFGK